MGQYINLNRVDGTSLHVVGNKVYEAIVEATAVETRFESGKLKEHGIVNILVLSPVEPFFVVPYSQLDKLVEIQG